MTEHDERKPDDRVGVGTPPGESPAVGTGPRSHRNTAPPTGRVDDERAAWGSSGEAPERVADVGGPLSSDADLQDEAEPGVP